MLQPFRLIDTATGLVVYCLSVAFATLILLSFAGAL